MLVVIEVESNGVRKPMTIFIFNYCIEKLLVLLINKKSFKSILGN